MKMVCIGTLIVGLLVGAVAHGSQIRIPVDSARSSLFLQLCANPGGLGTDCDDDTKPIGGFVTMALDDNGNPAQVALRNLDLQAIGTYELNLSWLFGAARVDATASNLRIYHARPGTTNPPVPLVMGTNYTFLEVPFLTAGTASYQINDLACSFVTFPCSSNINLANLGENSIDTLTGNLRIANGVLFIDIRFSFETPLDDTNPDLGTFNGTAVVRGSAPIPAGLVPRHSDWKFLDDGSNQGASWILLPPLFDDASWPLGVGQLGYGDGDEDSVVGFGPDSTNKFVTTYFRHTFNVPDASIYTNLALRVLSDDGVIVYLNEVEIYRANMPGGAFPDYLTLASSAVAGAAENVYFLAPPVDLSLLFNGLNLLAAEIHQASPDSSDISFDLELMGNTTLLNALPAVSITRPTNGASLAGAPVTIEATATDADGIVSLVEFFESGNKIGEATGAGPLYAFNWTGVCPGTYVLTARATDNAQAAVVSAPIVVTITGSPVSLINQGAIWRYLDTGANLGAAWRSNSFSDAAWLSGPAQLGFGDGDEATTIMSNRQVTTYFRRAFTVNNAAGIATLTLRLLRDDGAVVYANGAEVYRNNMPAGAIAFDTLAPVGATAQEETNFFFTTSLNPNVLVEGNNLLAVEVHQNSTNSSDLSFDLSLAVTLSNRPPNVVAITAPTNNAIFPLGADITLRATAADPDGTIARVDYYAGSNKIGQATSPPYTLVWNDVPAGAHHVTARAVDNCGAAGVSAVVLVRVGAFTMIPSGSLWRYLDNGSDQGTAWRAHGFNHSSWPEGRAELGYGDGGEITPLARTNAGGTTNITFYFRRAFPVIDPSIITGLVVRLLRDDGAVGYLNGTEVFRSNMPTGPVNYLTPATTAVGGADETTFFPIEIDRDGLLPDTNVLAVEIHQQSIGSTDVSYDLELIGLVGEVHPQLFIQRAGNSHVLRWPSSAAGFRLQSSADLRSTANWQDQAGSPTDNGAWKTLSLPNSSAVRFYRLSQ